MGIVALWIVKAEQSVWDLHEFLQLILQLHPNESEALIEIIKWFRGASSAMVSNTKASRYIEANAPWH